MVICYSNGIIVAAGIIIIGAIFYHCDLTAVWLVTDNLSWLQMFLSGYILYAINNFGNESVLFGVIFICGDWSSYIGVFTFIYIPFIYRLFSIWIFQYKCLIIVDE